MRLLIVEDDAEASEAMARGLTEAGHECQTAEDGEAGFAASRRGRFDVMIVDRMMPKLDGVGMVERIRQEGDQTPVLFLSALGEINHRVEGLRAGGDDYLVKPYAFSELLARLEALLRRGSATPTTTKLRVAELEMDLLSRSVRRGSQKIDLQPREFRLLEYLMRHAGQVVTRTMLLEGVWDYHFDPQTNVIDVHVSRLRQKIDKPFELPLLHTVRNAGYMLRSEEV